MECVYNRFESYNFEGDVRYQEGFNKLNSTLSAEDLLKLKIFFYNKFVEPIDLTGYQNCRAKYSTSDHLEENNSHQASGHNNDIDKATSEKDSQLSFAEVFRMIQTGEEIPGLKKLDIKPCNQLPTVSQMSRKLKPWEK